MSMNESLINVDEAIKFLSSINIPLEVINFLPVVLVQSTVQAVPAAGTEVLAPRNNADLILNFSLSTLNFISTISFHRIKSMNFFHYSNQNQSNCSAQSLEQCFETESMSCSKCRLSTARGDALGFRRLHEA